ncbi:FtsK/SpoIIIE domain-containing protein [Streptomyces sp. ME01-24h]|nr:FtsK/SpoIIIE domain-containing protein [Streptomyces sp. ME01-24h]
MSEQPIDSKASDAVYDWAQDWDTDTKTKTVTAGTVVKGPWPAASPEPTTEWKAPNPATVINDPMARTPLTPDWAKTRDGWKTRGHIAGINTGRRFRRWARRQATEHGHPAQVYRGIARTLTWVRGVEGAEVAKAKHDARLAQSEYKQAKQRHARRLLPGGEKDRLARKMQLASDDSAKAVDHYRKEQKKARGRQAWRGIVAATPIAALEATGATLAGGTGATLTAGLTLAGLALLGRRTNAGETWTDHEATFGDTHKLTDVMVNRIYHDAKVISGDDVLRLITPCLLTADGQAWEVSFDLPSGVPTKKALNAKEAIAGALGVAVQQVHQARGDREGRIRLRVSLRLPFTGELVHGPLLDAARVNLWRPIPMGINLRGEAVSTSWVERSGMFGGEPGSGKSAAANDLLLAAALDPTVPMYLADGKAGADITPFEPIATMYDTDGDPEKLLAILNHIWNVEIPNRRALAKEHGSRKLTEAMAAVDPRVCLAVLLVDEWSSYMAAAERKIRDELERLLRLIVQQGRALGVITLAATQKPDSDSVPTGIRDILSIRWAMRCLTPQASDTILGQGYASAGHNAQDILKSQRGVGIYMDGEGAEPELVRGHYYDDDEVAAILQRAYGLREKAGTLPVAPVVEVTLLDCLIKAVSSTGRGEATKAEVFAYLADVDEEYGRRDDESDAQYGARVGKLLAGALADEKADIKVAKVASADGRESRGYRLEDLAAAR